MVGKGSLMCSFANLTTSRQEGIRAPLAMRGETKGRGAGGGTCGQAQRYVRLSDEAVRWVAVGLTELEGGRGW